MDPNAKSPAAKVMDEALDLALLSQPFPRESRKLGFRLLKPWRGAGVVERGSLENCWRRKALVGSNPTLSVKTSKIEAPEVAVPTAGPPSF